LKSLFCRASLALAALAAVALAAPASSRAADAPGTRAVVVDPAKSTPDKSCVAATRRLEREQSSLDAAQGEVERYRKLRAGCTSKSSCARYDSALATLDKRTTRQQRRIERFDASRKDACPSSQGIPTAEGSPRTASPP
jgi:hypothetical protein